MGNYHCKSFLCVERDRSEGVNSLMHDLGSMESELLELRRELDRERADLARVRRRAAEEARVERARRAKKDPFATPAPRRRRATATGFASPGSPSTSGDNASPSQMPRVLDREGLTPRIDVSFSRKAKSVSFGRTSFEAGTPRSNASGTPRRRALSERSPLNERPDGARREAFLSGADSLPETDSDILDLCCSRTGTFKNLDRTSGSRSFRRHSCAPELLRQPDIDESTAEESSGEVQEAATGGARSTFSRASSRRCSAPAFSLNERGLITSGCSLRALLSRPDWSPIRKSEADASGESKASLWRVCVTRPEAEGCFLGGHVDLCQQLEQRRFRAVTAEHCYDVTKSYGVHVVCIAKTHALSCATDGDACEEPGMDWTPGDTTQLRLHDLLYVLGSRDCVSRFAEAVGVMKELNEELEWSSIGVPKHWVGWRLGRQTDERPNGLNLRVLCGATLLGLRNPDGTVKLVPDANTELEEGQEMLFLHSLKSHPGAAFEFEFDKQLLDPECWRRLSNAVTSVLRGAVCGVCFETLQAQECRKFPCGHMFHAECVRDYILEFNCCPMCREPVWEWKRQDGKWTVMDRTVAYAE